MQDELYMKRALYLAGRADLSSVRGNPRVGAVLVCEGRIIGEGWHQVQGKAHAEVHCMNSVKPKDIPLISRSTLYVTLEPCAHEGRTPSCAKMLAHRGIKKAVIGTLDPFPEVSGKGCRILQDAGIEVEIGLLESECRQIANVFLTNQLKRRPYVILKWAESQDGFIDCLRDDHTHPAVPLSTPFTQLLTHRLRGDSTAILIGSRTALLDHPKLSNRLWEGLPSPRKVVLMGDRTQLPQYIHQDPSWLTIPDGKDLTAVLNHLYKAGITTLLVEGGTTIHNAFVHAGLWDLIRREIAPTYIHYGVPAPIIPADAHMVSSQSFQSNSIICYTP